MNKIFISYSHLDEQWKDLLQSHLSVIEKQSKLRIWDDRQIATGDDWLHEIEKALTTSESALLLISRHFLTSDFILSKEIPRLLQRREKEGLRIIPLIISPCAWQTVDWLAAIQGYPADNVALSSRDEPEIDRLLAALGQQLYEQVDNTKNIENAENKATLQQPQSQLKFRPSADNAQVIINNNKGITLEEYEAGLLRQEKRLRDEFRTNMGELTPEKEKNTKSRVISYSGKTAEPTTKF